jgi:hypothetical protein
MGRQIMLQPDGRDATVGELVDFFAEDAAELARREVTRLAEAVAAGRDPYPLNAPTRTWAEAVEADREHGGEFSEGRDR